MKCLPLIFGVMLGIFGFSFARPSDSLRFVHYLFRHGERSPKSSYNGDPNIFSTTWPKGPAQLTSKGMRQHYQLGKFFRERYDGFLDSIYHNRDVYVRSTDVDRTLMSAYSHLAGLYPPKNEDVWNEAILWQPIPVHTVPLSRDFELRWDACRRHAVERKKVLELPCFKRLTGQYADFLRWISREVNCQYDIDTVYNLTDALLIEKTNHLPIPKFANETVIKTLQDLTVVLFKSNAFTPELQRIGGGGGPLVKDIIARIRQKINGTLAPDLKMYIYSAHDTTLNGFLHALKSFNDCWPPFAAAVISELHEVNNQYYLQFSYKNETDHEPYNLTIPGCSFRCPFERFVYLTRPIIPRDIESECRLPSV